MNNGTNINVVFTGYTKDYRHQKHFDDLMEFAEKGRTAVLFFNHTGLNLLTEDSQSIWNVLEADH